MTIDLTAVIVAATVLIGGMVTAFLTFRGVLTTARTQQHEVRVAERKADLEGALAIADKWKDYSDNLEQRLRHQDDAIKQQAVVVEQLGARLDESDDRIKALEDTVHSALSHIAGVHDWAAGEGLHSIPPIPAVIYPMVAPLRKPRGGTS